jgi:hypothetical protein
VFRLSALPEKGKAKSRNATAPAFHFEKDKKMKKNI